jgi:urease accessory protein
MTELSGPALLRLTAALSPTFPIGSFSFSHGLERAVHDGLVTCRDSLESWLRDLLAHGSAWNDAVLLAAAWNDRFNDPETVELGRALAGSRERLLETSHQGSAFGHAASTWGGSDPEDGDLVHPVAVGAFARRSRIPLEAVLSAWLQAFASNLIQAGLRLAPIGQAAGVRTLVALEPVILETAARAARSSLDDLGSATFISDIAAMRHETQYSRIFRS